MKLVPFDRLHMVSVSCYCPIVTLRYSTSKMPWPWKPI